MKLEAGAADPIPSNASPDALAPVTNVRGVLKKCAAVAWAASWSRASRPALTTQAGVGSGWVPSPAWASAAKLPNRIWPGPAPGTPQAKPA